MAASCLRPLSRTARPFAANNPIPRPGSTHTTRTSNLRQAHQKRFVSAYGYEQAKALTYSEHGDPQAVLKLHSHSISPAHSSLVTVRFLASPMNPADINTIQGTYPSKPAFTTALSTPTPAAVPGNEGVAQVISAGTAATREHGLHKGDWVVMRGAAAGTWRTHMQDDASKFLKLSDADREGVSAVQAGTVSVNPCTAWAMLRGYVGTGAGEGTGGARAGEWFVQNGANSGVGRAAIQLAAAWGVRSINVVRARPDGDDATRALKDELRALGADVVVTEDEAAEKDFPQRVKEWTDGGREPVALGLNCVGGRSALNLSKVLADGRWLLTYGAMARQPLSVPAGMLIFKDLRFAGFWVSRWAEANPQDKMAAIGEVLQLTREGRFKDTPFVEVPWEWNTEEKTLVDAVQSTLEGYRGGKGVFVFGET